MIVNSLDFQAEKKKNLYVANINESKFTIQARTKDEWWHKSIMVCAFQVFFVRCDAQEIIELWHGWRQ